MLLTEADDALNPIYAKDLTACDSVMERKLSEGCNAANHLP